MLVGAHCRDILHASQGHGFGLVATEDVDFGIALTNWTAFDNLAANLESVGDTGIRFMVGGVPIDLMPFGNIERPPGVVTPQERDESMSVWAFQEAFDRADVLVLPTAGRIRIPTIPGYVALKLAAWLDRSAWGKYKDAGDLAAAMHWYCESNDVADWLYEDEAGIGILVQYEVDPARAALHRLGSEVLGLVGIERHNELAARWPGERGDLLPGQLDLPYASGWPSTVSERLQRLNAFERGLDVQLTTLESPSKSS